MDIVNILNSMKDKVLDEANYECLKNIFERQASNITQLKENNATLRDTVEKLQTKKNHLKKEHETLMLKVSQLEEQVSSGNPSAKPTELSEVEREVLESCLDSGIKGFCSEDMHASLPFSRMKIAMAIGALEQKEIIHLSSISADGSHYELTESGKNYLSQIEKDDYSF